MSSSSDRGGRGTPAPPEPPPLRAALARTALRLVVLALAVAAIQFATGWLLDRVGAMPLALRGPTTLAVLAVLLGSYAGLLALPFVPGIEIGLAVLMAHGAPAAPFVYLATVLGLTLAFCAGRFVQLVRLRAVFRDLHMRRACRLIDEIAPLNRRRRLALLRRRLPSRLAPHLVAWRHVLLALLINLPGNAVIGGGGGIMLLAGMSGLIGPRAAVLTVALAVAPVPLAVVLVGREIIG